MVTNVTVHAVGDAAVVYFQDNTSISIPADTEQQFQIVEDGFCTISDAPTEEVDPDAPHPDQGLPQPGKEFVEKMRDYWNALWDQIGDEIDETRPPQINPL